MSDGSLTSVETRQNLSRVIPAEIADIFGHPPVLSTENRQAYDALMTQLARHREKIEVEIERVGELSLRAARRFIAKPRGHNIIKAQALENQSRRDG